MVLILIMVFGILISCNSDSVSSEQVVIDNSSIYKSTNIDIPDNFRNNYDNINEHGIAKPALTYFDDKAYLLGRSIIDNEQFPVFIVYDLNSKTSVMENIVTYNDGAAVNNIAFDTQMNQITIEAVGGVITLNKMSSSGDKIFSFEISSDKQKVMTDSSDNIYVAFSDSLESYDSDGNTLNSVSFGGLKYNDFGILSNGRIYVEFINSRYHISYKYVNNDMKSLSNTIIIDINTKMYAGPGYDVYYSNNANLYGYNESDNTMYTLVNWNNSNIAHSGIYQIYIISIDMFVYYYRDPIKNETYFYLAEKTDDVTVPQSNDIVIGYMRNVYMLDIAVNNYNITNNKYNVVLKSYYDAENYQGNPIKLNNDILSGDVPDIIIPDDSMPMMSYINKGLFVDMYEFIDNDPDLSRDSFYNIIYSTYERDGKLYQFAADMEIFDWLTKEESINGKDTWTYDEFYEFYKSLPDDVVFNEKLNRTELEYIFYQTGLSDFVDYKNGTCDFENELFYDIINIIKSMNRDSYIWTDLNENERNNFYLIQPDLFRNEKIIVSRQFVESPANLMTIMHRFGFEDITFMSYPTPYGDKNASILSSTEFMITEQSQVKEGSWDFIKYYISDDVQMARIGGGLPTKKDVLKHQFEYLNSFHLYIDQIGTPYAEFNEFTEEEMKSMGLTAFEFTDEHFAIIENLMNSTNRQYSYDEQLTTIISEELSAFFEGAKTAEETAKIIQNRASVYLHEIK